MPEKLTTESELQIQDSVKTNQKHNGLNLTEQDKKLLRSKYDVMVFAHDCNPENIDKVSGPQCCPVTYEVDGVVNMIMLQDQE